MRSVSHCLAGICAAVLLQLVLASAASAQYWSHAFGPMGLNGPPGYDGETHCLAAKDGKLYVGGWFQDAGGQPSAYIAAWNGTYWEDMAGGISWQPRFILPVETGLVVGGGFVPGVVFWDGAWSDMDNNLPADVNCGALHNGGIFVGNMFWIGDPVNPVAPFLQWSTGSGWFPHPNSGAFTMGDEVLTMAHSNGYLHLGGNLTDYSTTADTTWNHVAWSEDTGLRSYGRGLEPGGVFCMEPDATGLWLGGGFLNADGEPSHGLVHLFGDVYQPVAEPEADRVVHALRMFNDVLYVAQNESHPDPVWVVRQYLTTPDAHWSEPLGGVFTGPLNAIEARDPYELYVGGTFANGIVRWDEGEWVHLGGGIGRLNFDRHWLTALVEYEGQLIAAGRDMALPSVLEGVPAAMNVLRWNGTAWHRMGAGIADDVSSLAVFGGELYAGLLWDVSGSRVMRWDGVVWQGVAPAQNQVLALTVHDGELIAAGSFTSIGGVTANRVAAFDGVAWRPLGQGMDLTVDALFSNGGVLYAAGGFTTADGAPAARIARWTGSAWEPMGAGFANGYVNALTAYQGGIIAGGSFLQSDGVAVNHVARWDGAAWRPLGAGIGGDVGYSVKALRGTTTDLYVGGDFTEAGGAPAAGVAVWDGAAWSELAGGISGGQNLRPTVSTFLVHDGDLYLGGNFAAAGGVPSCCMARWVDGDLVPNRVGGFRAVPSAGRGPTSVTVAWESPTAVPADAFRLRGSRGGAAWDVAHGTADGRRFSATDASPLLAAGGHVTYALDYREEGGSWLPVQETTVALAVPAAPAVLQVAPNPFNPRTTVTFVMPRAGRASLAVHDLAGRRVVVLADRDYAPGAQRVTWDGTDARGRALGSGTYVVRLVTDQGVRAAKVMLVR